MSLLLSPNDLLPLVPLLLAMLGLARLAYAGTA